MSVDPIGRSSGTLAEIASPLSLLRTGVAEDNPYDCEQAIATHPSDQTRSDRRASTVELGT